MENSGKHGRVWLDINLGTLRENFGKIRNAVQPCGVIAVLKADAYGLGFEKIAGTLAKAGAVGFGVAELSEALAIRKFKKPVQILGAVLPEEIPDAVNAGIILPINDYEIAEMISRESSKQKKKAECHFLIDTGMGRLGMVWQQAEKTIRKCVKLPNIDFTGIYTHFPVAYQSGREYTAGQIRKFLEILESLSKSGINFRKVHCANSDAVNNFPFTYKSPFNLVRTGLDIHGSFDIEGKRSLNLKSVLTLKTRLAAARTLEAGARIGYGCTYTLPRKMLVGTISAGYADGIPFALSNKGYVIIRGKPCGILGRVSMDYTTVSLEQIPESQRGDEVICLGGEGILEITVESWAQLKTTHPHEIICSFGKRVKRCYSA